MSPSRVRSATREFLIVIAMIVVTSAVAGCRADRPTLVEASGNVLMNGQPLTAGAIYFHPDATNNFQDDQPSSLLELDGSFRIKTFPHGDGVPPGKYRVTLAPALASRIHRPEFADPAKTPWIVEVPEDGLRGYTFEVK